MKLLELAGLVDGKVAGDGQVKIRGVAPIEEAKSGDLVFVLDHQFLASAVSGAATALVISPKMSSGAKPALVVDDPRQAMVVILASFATQRTPCSGIHQSAVVPASCRLGKNVSIGAYAVLGEKVSIGAGTVIGSQVYVGNDCRIGRDCYLHPQCSLYDGTEIGDRVIIHTGCRIGVDGYGFIQQGGKHQKIPQIGRVVIEDDVELFANVCVSRATLGATVIGAGTKIDNLTHVAHNCRIGKDCAIVSLVGFAGSVTLGDRVYVAGQSGFSGHITVGENSVVMAKSGVTKDIPPNSVVSGFPAQDHRKEISTQAALRRLAKKAK